MNRTWWKHLQTKTPLAPGACTTRFAAKYPRDWRKRIQDHTELEHYFYEMYKLEINHFQISGSALCHGFRIQGRSCSVRVRSTVSTSADQVAVAPGSLVREWTDEATGRRHFAYAVEGPVMNFYSFVSGRYEVQRERLDSVDLEVYHLPEHGYNVPKMFEAMRASLTYYRAHFGPYPRRQARIIEFPRYASFAQAFPGTMPHSESIGFIADLTEPDALDFVFFVVAHEMGHQWWAHQVIGADVQGGTMLSETFAQYVALMVGKERYGDAYMRKMLKYEMDRYLRGRGGEREAERPLTRVENQAYIHYRKGSVVMYALQDYLGEDTVNAALRAFYDAWALQGPPYPTTHDFLAVLRPRVPDSLAYVVDEWLEDIVLYNNRVVSAAAKPVGDDRYEVTFTVDVAKVRADSLGHESPLPIDGDYIDVGVFAEASDDNEDVLGEPLWRERVRFDAVGARTFTVTVDGEPAEVAVDPKLLLVDRLKGDNRKAID